MLRLILFTIAIFLSACSAPDRDIVVQGPIPIPINKDPTDQQLKQALNSFLENTEAPISSQYQFSRIDLDGDGRRDGLVLFKNPYGYWCGMHGCTMLVLKAHNDGFTLVNSIQPIREPLYVATNEETNGWKDMFVRVSGRWDDAKDVKIAFNGSQYPDNPAHLPNDPTFSFSEAVPLFQRY
ncbi:MAG: hypothetical protein KTR28_01460 [Micavibrio sp.]|nr:hypothetical protein [Micavibrio sp.]